MRVQLGTWEITDDDRQTLKRWLGQRGLATRDDCRTWAHDALAAMLKEVSKEVATMPPLPTPRRGRKGPSR